MRRSRVRDLTSADSEFAVNRRCATSAHCHITFGFVSPSESFRSPPDEITFTTPSSVMIYCSSSHLAEVQSCELAGLGIPPANPRSGPELDCNQEQPTNQKSANYQAHRGRPQPRLGVQTFYRLE